MNASHPDAAQIRVVLTVDPSGAYPVTLPAEPFHTVCAALGLGALGEAVGSTRLATGDVWTFTVGDTGYRMEVPQ